MTEEAQRKAVRELVIDEADLAVDYFRFASRVNPLAAISNYKQYNNLKQEIDKRALFIAQQFLLLNSHEDLAKFLHALHIRKEKGTTIQWTLSSDKDSLSHYPNDLKKCSRPSELLAWLGIDYQRLVKTARRKGGLSKKDASRLISERAEDMMKGFETCRRNKLQRHKAYNATKHGKPIISIEPKLLYKLEEAAEANGPHFFHQQKLQCGSYQLWTDSVPFSDQQFYAVTRAIIQIAEVIRDIIYFFVSENYPDKRHHLQQSYDDLLNFRKEAKELFKGSDTQ